LPDIVEILLSPAEFFLNTDIFPLTGLRLAISIHAFQ